MDGTTLCSYLAQAADYHVMLDAHEPVRPTGLQHLSNWMASQAAEVTVQYI